MIGEIFTLVLLNPMMNFLIILNNLLFGSFGLAIIAFTIIIRLVTFPLTLRQLHQTRAMQSIQPRVAEINKKYSDPKRRQEEMMKIYKESGVNPLGCLGPMLVQMPILIALYYAIRQTLPESPEALENLSTHLYSWSFIQSAVPLKDTFLGMDLRETNLPMVILVGLTTWAQTKTTVSVSTDEKQKAQQQMMTYMMPLMFAFFALSFPSGVSLYWVVNSLVGILFNVSTYGFPLLKIEPIFKHKTPGPQRRQEADGKPARGSASPLHAGSRTNANNGNAAAHNEPARELRTANGSGRSKRQNRRRRP